MQTKEELKKVFYDFYGYILKDPYLAVLIPSYLRVNDLISKQVGVFEKSLELLKNGNIEEAKRVAENLARLHVEMRIHETFMLEAINFLRERLRVYKISEKDIKTYGEFLKMFEESFLKTYIRIILEETLALLSSETEQQHAHVNWLRSLYNFVISGDDKLIPQLDFTRCELGIYINSLQFEIKTFLDKSLRLKIELEHRDLHRLASAFVSYYKKGNLKKALSTLRSMTRSSLFLFSLIKESDLKWEVFKEKIFSEYLTKNCSPEDFIVLIVPYTAKRTEMFKNVFNKFIKELKVELKKFNNFIFTSNDVLYIFIKDNNLSYRKIKEVLENTYTKNVNGFAYSFERVPFRAFIVSCENLQGLNSESVNEFFKVLVSEYKDESFIQEDIDIMSLIVYSKERTLLREKLTRNLSSDILVLYYQPVYELFSEKEVGGEILSRVKLNGNLISAYGFLDIVKEEKLTADFDSLVLGKLLENSKTLNGTLFINLFPSSLISKKVINLLKNLIRDFKGNIVIEITEHELFMSKEVIKHLQLGKVSLAIDDFGAGYANFISLGNLISSGLVKYIKIDGNIVRSILREKSYKNIVKSILTFCEDTETNVIFEFVENEEILNEIRELVSLYKLKALCQGYYFSRPKELLS